MNMISTGAFLTEMDASTKQNDLVSKLVRVWEKKNAKLARAGGVSLMALSLAACGSDDDVAVTTPVVETPTAPTTPTTPVVAAPEVLTNATDTISINGTLDAGMVWSPGGDERVESLQSEDTVTGAGTADVINITSDGGAVAPKLLNIETVNYNVAGATAGTLNISNSTGITALKLTSTDGNATATGLTAGIALSASDMADAATNAAFSFKSSAVVGTTAATVTVDGFEGNNLNIGASAAATVNGTGIETLTINASGDTSVIANVGSTGVTTLNVDADAQLTISALASTGVGTINLTGSTAATSIDVDDSISANVFSYTGGAGADTLIANSGFAGTDGLDGGDGADTFSIRPASLAGDVTVGALSSASAAVVSNIETLDMRSATGLGTAATDFTVDMDHMPGVTAVTMRTADNDLKAVFTLNDLTADQASALTVTHTGTDADTDSEVIVDMKVNATDTVKLAATVSAATQVVELNDANNNIENAEITLAGAFNSNLDVDVSSFGTSLKVSGGAAGNTLTVANAHTSATLDMSGVDSAITATLGAGTQTANFGTAADTITMAAGAKTLDAGAGNDTVSTTVALVGATDTIKGGEGTDTLQLTTIAAITAASFAKVEGFERLVLNQANLGGDITIDLDNFNSTFSRITIGDSDDDVVTIDNAGSSFNDLRYSFDLQATPTLVADSEIALNRKTDNASNEVTLTIAGGNTLKTVDLADEETITIAGSGTGTVTIQAATITDATKLIYTGSNAIAHANTAAGLVNEGQLSVVDATALTGALTLNASASVVNMALTGNENAGGAIIFVAGAGADTITGGFAGDTLNGGIGVDTISGGSGGDTIDGDAGNDTITGGGGIDIIITGEGSDTITDFSFGASGDQIRIDLSGVNANLADGATAIVLTEADLNTGDLANADNIVATVITGAQDLDLISDGGNLLVLNGTVSQSGLETALSVGGSFELTLGAQFDNDDAFLVLHTDGTNAYLTAVANTSGSNIADADTLTTGELNVVTVTTFSGISSLAAYNADNDTTIIT
jgi:hypothetical protein